ncbi:hypothetical protein M409DRAFT_24225 [Zasmidium cellare ATCC 36951]|uniref:Zn(2)-C6 fungal-type domain-containing protein n=1 Tax=Zasmidium cellare ATCC 36951 TaxID=1080233 RepID=A0A6A6CE40_ZASCE|nr:uncharacterized protein M409DRAFT_24225 [Zasmidium cellare ATCC 36951]KAF2165375.1 hypothetical protein M409DRAFT_24225 [Zasmidium cellare ATCC 36951]
MDNPASSEDTGGASQPNRAQKRRRVEVARRSTNACHRCKAKKLKCHFDATQAQGSCAACRKADAECVFDIAPDGVPRGSAYIAVLEDRINTLEGDLHVARNEVADLRRGNSHIGHQISPNPSHSYQRPTKEGRRVLDNVAARRRTTKASSAATDITIFNLLEKGRVVAESETGALPDLPSQAVANQLFEAAYYARALRHLHAALAPQDLTSVQALLILVQYCFRAYGGPSVWHIVGAATRLCIELGYHRQKNADDSDPLEAELQKRTFWCAYAFDRLVSIVSNRPFSIHDQDIDVNIPIDIDIECTDISKIRELQAQQVECRRYWGPETTSMSSCLHNLHMYRLRSKILTQFHGPHAVAPSFDVVVDLLAELDTWKEQAPPTEESSGTLTLPNEQVQAAYLRAMINLMRPVLSRPSIDPNLLHHFAALSADACENAKTLSICFNHQASPIQVHTSFHCGITLLQCLAVQPTVLPLRRTLKAISACSSALSVYTRSLAPAAPFLQLFDKLCDLFLSRNDQSDGGLPIDELRNILQKVVSSDPSETSEILYSIHDDQMPNGALNALPQTTGTDDSILLDDNMWNADFLAALNSYDLPASFEHLVETLPHWS